MSTTNTNKSKSKKSKSWTKEETALLVNVPTDMANSAYFKKIAKQINRTPGACYQKYVHYHSGNVIKTDKITKVVGKLPVIPVDATKVAKTQPVFTGKIKINGVAIEVESNTLTVNGAVISW